MTILIPILMGGLLFGGAVIGNRIGSNHIAVVTDNPQFAEDLKTELSGHIFAKPSSTSTPPLGRRSRPARPADAEAQHRPRRISLGHASCSRAVARHLRWDQARADIVLKSRVADAVRGVLARETLAQKGMSATEVNDLLKPVELKPPPKDRKNSDAAFVSAYGLFFLMRRHPLLWDERRAVPSLKKKTSRVFEVMLSKVRPAEMMAGKVIGVGSGGLTQGGLWIAVALVAFKIQGLATEVDSSLPTPGQLVCCFVIFFILGYILYSSIAAALGGDDELRAGVAADEHVPHAAAHRLFCRHLQSRSPIPTVPSRCSCPSCPFARRSLCTRASSSISRRFGRLC